MVHDDTRTIIKAPKGNKMTRTNPNNLIGGVHLMMLFHCHLNRCTIFDLTGSNQR